MEYSIKEVSKLFKDVKTATVRGWIRSDLKNVKDDKDYVLSKPDDNDQKKPWILTEKAVEIIKNKHINKFIDVDDMDDKNGEVKVDPKVSEAYMKIRVLNSEIKALKKNNEDLRSVVIDLRNQRDLAQQTNLKLMSKLPNMIEVQEDNKGKGEEEKDRKASELIAELEELNNSLFKRIMNRKRINELISELKNKK
ncbi:hypothetical protein [Ligilactobacillus aviarius]|uniref:hypothetical protein n=1 Tax=Ligilactobacillus aviarius TaxID=1606 RepID=UPI0024BBBC67|nr:hypothetical protein [Ligilactobacillus aviarius]